MTTEEEYRVRFAQRYQPEPNTGCFLWAGCLRSEQEEDASKDAYGGFHYHGKARYAHRVSWLLFRGPIPDGFNVCHRCDVRLCVNPDHLFLGTQSDNMRDCVKKNRLNCWNATATHCRRGHEFSPENGYVNARLHRVCRVCVRDRLRRNALAKRQQLSLHPGEPT